MSQVAFVRHSQVCGDSHFYSQVIRATSHLGNRLRHTSGKGVCTDSLSLCSQPGLRRPRFCCAPVLWMEEQDQASCLVF